MTIKIIIPSEPPNKVFKIIEIPFIPPSIIELGIKISSRATADITAPIVIKISDKQKLQLNNPFDCFAISSNLLLHYIVNIFILKDN